MIISFLLSYQFRSSQLSLALSPLRIKPSALLLSPKCKNKFTLWQFFFYQELLIYGTKFFVTALLNTSSLALSSHGTIVIFMILIVKISLPLISKPSFNITMTLTIYLFGFWALFRITISNKKTKAELYILNFLRSIISWQESYVFGTVVITDSERKRNEFLDNVFWTLEEKINSLLYENRMNYNRGCKKSNRYRNLKKE